MDPLKTGDRDIKDSIVMSAVTEVISSLTPDQKAVILELLAKEKQQERSATAQHVPVSIFSTKSISGLEAISKYLKDEANLEFKKIGEILNRNEVTIRTSYKRAVKKLPEKLDLSNYSLVIPIRLFRDRNNSVLEVIVAHLHDHYDISFKEIARLLCRNYKTVWTVYSKSRKKKNNAGR